MKYLEMPELGLLASTLSSSSQSVRVTTRIEAYSCKSVASERKMIKSLDQEFTSDLEMSNSASSPELPPSALQSAFGRLDRKDCRKTFWLLIATLNAAYPDHNFSHVKVEDFDKDESPRAVLLKMSEALEFDGSGSIFASSLGALSISPGSLAPISDGPQVPGCDSLAGVHPLIRQVLDPVIDLAQCEVYSYSPDPDSDPHAVDSDEEDEVESVASSIYGSNRPDVPSPLPQRNGDDDTMWEMEEVDAPHYTNASDDTSILSFRQPHMSLQTFSVPNTPLTNQNSRPGFSSRVDKHYTQNNKHSNSRSSINTSSAVEEDSAGGLLWSSHYFFYNRKMKRILFISTWGRKVLSPSSFHDSTLTYQGQEQVNYLLTSHSISVAGHGKIWTNSSTTKPAENLNTSAVQSDLVDVSGDHKRRLSLSFPKLSSFTGHIEKNANRTENSEATLSRGLLRPKKKMRKVEASEMDV